MKTTNVSSSLLLLAAALGVASCQPDVQDLADLTSSELLQENPESASAPESPSAKPRYLQVDITAGPANLDGWSPIGLSNRSEVYGQGFDCDDQGICLLPLLKRRTNGSFATLASNFLVNDVNLNGDVGGCVIDDPVTFVEHAAIVRSNGKLELIPPLPGETASCVVQLSGNRTAVVASVDAANNVTTYIREQHRITPFTVAGASVADVNDRGQVTGIISSNPDAQRAYRFDARTGTTTILNPVPPDAHTWGLGLDSQGEVLGYSFDFDGIERIGKWNRRNVFEVAFTEGTPQFPTVSNRLVWNEAGLIIISYSLNDPNTYLVPKPGVRLALADLVTNGPTAETLFVLQVNERSDFVATSLVDGRSLLYCRK